MSDNFNLNSYQIKIMNETVYLTRTITGSIEIEGAEHMTVAQTEQVKEMFDRHDWERSAIEPDGSHYGF